MFSHASLTARVSGDLSAVTKDAVERRVDDLCKPKTFGCLKIPWHVQPLPRVVSLAPQVDSQTGTITFPGRKSKERALRELTGWRVDDTFEGLTVLHSAPEPDLEYNFFPPRFTPPGSGHAGC